MKKTAFLVLLAVFLAAFAISGYYLLDYYISNSGEQAEYKHLIDLRKNAAQSDLPAGSDKIISQYQKLYELNNDLVGWLEIPETIIDYPVVQNLDDPQYYLNHSFSKQSSRNGCIFIDARCDPAHHQNVIIYGHNMKSGAMFSGILDYNDKAFFLKHNLIYFDTLYEQREYEVVACFQTDIPTASANKTIYDFVEIDEASAFESFISLITANSIYDTVFHTKPGDEFLTLSTCIGDSDSNRFVVVARRIH